MKKYSRPRFYGAEIFAALVFLCSMSAAFMYTLNRSVVLPTTCIMTALSFGVYMLFYALRKRRAFSFLAFIGCFTVSIFAFSVLNGISSISPIDYLFKASEFYDDFMAGAFISIFSFIIGFSTAYFNVYLPRPAFLLLPAFIPLLLAAKTSDGLPAEYVVFMAVGYALVLLGVSRPEFPSENVYFDDKKSRFERLGALGIFGLIIAVTIYSVPRSDETPLGEYLDTVFNRNANLYGGNGLRNPNSQSGVNRGDNDPSENIMFYAEADHPAILSDWSFDIYTESGSWRRDPDLTTGWSGWQTYKKTLSAQALFSKLYNGVKNGYLSDYREILEDISYPSHDYDKDRSPRSQTMKIYVVSGGNTRLIIHPNKTVGVNISGYDERVFRTLTDDMFTEKDFGTNAQYTLEYYSSTPSPELITLFEYVDMEEILTAAENEGVITTTEKEAFLNERTQALEYHELMLTEPISPRIAALANEITEGLTSEYAKAAAIEQWFGEAGFVYDLNFIPEETTAEYFLFESKRGICTDFAAASTLLLRAANIPTKYGTGFLLKEENRNAYGVYAVKAANAHAFSMSYIEGYGWLEVDGTRYVEVAEEEDGDTLLPLIILIAAIVLGVLAFIFRNEISEAVFAVSVKFRSENKKIRAVYLRTRKLACRIAEKDPRSTTSAEVCGIIANSLSLKTQAEEITSCADKLFYNNTVSPCADKLYKDYREIVKMKKKMRK
ncbi:MAG: transglutaminase domain-containing protein [Oscillospiraceae bacterium]|nr:transglutaminase domain-containing protein [Oscillospiraceae bacterium]